MSSSIFVSNKLSFHSKYLMRLFIQIFMIRHLYIRIFVNIYFSRVCMYVCMCVCVRENFIIKILLGLEVNEQPLLFSINTFSKYPLVKHFQLQKHFHLQILSDLINFHYINAMRFKE